MTIGQAIKSAREAKGLSQKQLGDRCGIAASAIGRLERGTIEPRCSTLRKIATALDTKASKLMHESEDK